MEIYIESERLNITLNGNARDGFKSTRVYFDTREVGIQFYLQMPKTDLEACRVVKHGNTASLVAYFKSKTPEPLVWEHLLTADFWDTLANKLETQLPGAVIDTVDCRIYNTRYGGVEPNSNHLLPEYMAIVKRVNDALLNQNKGLISPC